MKSTRRCLLLLPLRLCVLTSFGLAHDALVALSASLTVPVEKTTATDSKKDTGDRARLAFGSNGKFCLQIQSEAPLDILLGLNEQTTTCLAREGNALAPSQFFHAVGKRAQWSPNEGLVGDQATVLRGARVSHIAYCDPALAPSCGMAAVQTMKALGVFDALQLELDQSKDILEAYEFIASGNAESGSVAVLQIYPQDRLRVEFAWPFLATRYDPIRQDALLLEADKDHAAAIEPVLYRGSPKASESIRTFGYDL